MTKGEMCDRAGAILRSGKVRPEDDAFLRELVKHHPQAATKIGVGIDHFEIRRGGRFNQNVLWLIRRDGTETDISYRKCVNGDASHRAKVLAAMRAAIADQIIGFRDRALTADARCALTGVPLTRENLHVDHDPPFIKIAESFFARISGGVEAIRLTSEMDGSLGRTLADPTIVFDWREFHREHATLFLTSATANMRKGARKCPTPPTLRGAKLGESNAQEQEIGHE
jgi:hypothetical protein